MIIILIFGYVVACLAGIAGVTLAVSSGVKWHREDKAKIQESNKPDYYKIRILERDIYGGIISNMDGTLIDPDSAMGKVQSEQRSEFNKRYGVLTEEQMENRWRAQREEWEREHLS